MGRLAALDGDKFRRTMRQWAAGVTIITVGHLPDKVHGMTASSFTSVSCSPPLMLFCVGKSNDTHRQISLGTTVGVNLLSERQSRLSTRFAAKTDARYQFHDLNCKSGPNGTTLFRDCAAVMEVKITQAHDAGDHTIFIGKILWAEPNSGAKPLVYSQGSYARLAEILKD